MYNNYLIYIMGFIVAFLITRSIAKVIVKDMEGSAANPGWGALTARVLLSFGSWITVFSSLIMIIVYLIYKFIENKKIGDPPSWL